MLIDFPCIFAFVGTFCLTFMIIGIVAPPIMFEEHESRETDDAIYHTSRYVWCGNTRIVHRTHYKNRPVTPTDDCETQSTQTDNSDETITAQPPPVVSTSNIDLPLPDGPEELEDRGIDTDGLIPVTPHDSHASLNAELDGWKALPTFFQACSRGNVIEVDHMIQSGLVNPAAQDNYAIRMASASRHLDVVNRLLQDVRVDPTSDNNWALRIAYFNNDLDIVNRLLEDPRVDPMNTKNFK